MTHISQHNCAFPYQSFYTIIHIGGTDGTFSNQSPQRHRERFQYASLRATFSVRRNPTISQGDLSTNCPLPLGPSLSVCAAAIASTYRRLWEEEQDRNNRPDTCVRSEDVDVPSCQYESGARVHPPASGDWPGIIYSTRLGDEYWLTAALRLYRLLKRISTTWQTLSSDRAGLAGYFVVVGRDRKVGSHSANNARVIEATSN